VTLVTKTAALPAFRQAAFLGPDVDESTGAILMRAEFPNPQRALLPHVCARPAGAGRQRAGITVPQQAVIRGTTAHRCCWSSEDKVSARPVTTDAVQEGK